MLVCVHEDGCLTLVDCQALQSSGYCGPSTLQTGGQHAELRSSMMLYLGAATLHVHFCIMHICITWWWSIQGCYAMLCTRPMPCLISLCSCKVCGV